MMEENRENEETRRNHFFLNDLSCSPQVLTETALTITSKIIVHWKSYLRDNHLKIQTI